MGILRPILMTSRILSDYLPLRDGMRTIKQKEEKPRQLPEEGKSWAIVGRTGTGKTTFEKEFLKQKRKSNKLLDVYILDTKKLGDFTKDDGNIIYSFTPPLPIKKRGDVQIWQPEEDDIEMYSRYFSGILHNGYPAIVLIDEAKNLRFGMKTPRGLILLLTQGRLPGIHILACTQEVADSPRQIFSQPSHIICFNLWNDYDTTKMKKYLRIAHKDIVGMGLNASHAFWHLQTDIMGEPTQWQDYKSFFKQTII